MGEQAKGKRANSAYSIVSQPAVQDQLREAFIQCGPEEQQTVTGWLQSVQYNSLAKTWTKEVSLTDTEATVAPFASVAAAIRRDKLAILGEGSPLPDDLQALFLERFPQSFLPFEQVPYNRFPIIRWFEHPQFLQELYEAAKNHDPQVSSHKRFWGWLTAVSFDQQDNSWKEGAKDEGQWAKVAHLFEAKGKQSWSKNIAVKEKFIKGIRENEASIPEHLREELRIKFPADFTSGEQTLFYETLPIDERFANSTFQQKLIEALSAYEPELRKKKLSLPVWFRCVKYDADQAVWVADTKIHGPWEWAEKRNIYDLVQSADSPFPDEIKTLIKMKFPDDFIPLEEKDYRTTSSEEWLRHPQFHVELEQALQRSKHPDDISFIYWLRTVRPDSEEVWDEQLAKKFKTEPGPWRQLAQYCETSAVKRKKDWKTLFIGSSLPQQIQTLLIEKFPFNFADPITFPRYTLLAGNVWLSNQHFQQALLQELLQTPIPENIGFIHWLQYFAKVPREKAGKVALSSYGPWGKVSYSVMKGRTQQNTDNLFFLFSTYHLPVSLQEALKSRFPQDFPLQEKLAEKLLYKKEDIVRRRNMLGKTMVASLEQQGEAIVLLRRSTQTTLQESLAERAKAIALLRSNMQTRLQESLAEKAKAIASEHLQTVDSPQNYPAITLLHGGIFRVAQEILAYPRSSKEFQDLWETELYASSRTLFEDTDIISPLRKITQEEIVYYYLKEGTLGYFTNLTIDDFQGKNADKRYQAVQDYWTTFVSLILPHLEHCNDHAKESIALDSLSKSIRKEQVGLHKRQEAIRKKWQEQIEKKADYIVDEILLTYRKDNWIPPSIPITSFPLERYGNLIARTIEIHRGETSLEELTPAVTKILAEIATRKQKKHVGENEEEEDTEEV